MAFKCLYETHETDETLPATIPEEFNHFCNLWTDWLYERQVDGSLKVIRKNGRPLDENGNVIEYGYEG